MEEQDTVEVVEVEQKDIDTQPEETEAESDQEDPEALKAALDGKERQVAELEDKLADLEQRLQEQEGLYQEAEDKLVSVQEALVQTVARYRSVLLASAPEAPEAMVQGETVDEVDESFAQAKELVQHIKDRVEASLARERVPADSPTRSGLDFLAPGEDPKRPDPALEGCCGTVGTALTAL